MTRKETITVRDALSTVNPFMLRGETGRLILYENAKECYELVLMGLYAECPAGFIDIAYYMMKYQRLTSGQAWEILHQKQYAQVKWWNKDDPERVTTLRKVLRLLLSVSGCELDEELFQQSLENLDALLDKQGVRKTLSKWDLISIMK